MAGIEATKATAAGEAKDMKSESDTRSKKDGRLVPTTDDDDRKTPKKRRKVNHGRWLASLLLPPTPYPLFPPFFFLSSPPHHASSATRPPVQRDLELTPCALLLQLAYTAADL